MHSTRCGLLVVVPNLTAMKNNKFALLREEGLEESALPCSEVYAMVCRAV